MAQAKSVANMDDEEAIKNAKIVQKEIPPNLTTDFEGKPLKQGKVSNNILEKRLPTDLGPFKY